MKILVLNTGSSSIKFQVFSMPANQVLAKGLVEKLGEEGSRVKYKTVSDEEYEPIEYRVSIADHQRGLEEIVKLLQDPVNGVIHGTAEIAAVGHRVVHGGKKFKEPTKIDDMVLNTLHSVSYLAPLHNPAGIIGIEVAQQTFTEAVQVAVFDTAFHQHMPDYAYRYAIPSSFYQEHELRAYGFHGTSHQYVVNSAATFLNKRPEEFHAITIHLGNGCSMAAIKNGECIDTSMGLTPLGGLIMGSRSGDIDPSLILYMGKELGMSFEKIDHVLNKESGLIGIVGTNDLRAVLEKYEQNDPDARLAVEMYVYRIRKYIGAYAAALGRLDAVIFTAGVGENSPLIRQKVCDGLAILGMELDEQKNLSMHAETREIQTAGSQVSILVVPTNEELAIAQQTFKLCNGKD